VLEPVVVLVIIAIAVGAALFAASYRRFSRTRERFLAHMRRVAPEIVWRHPTDVGFTVDVLGAEVSVDLASLARTRPPGASERVWFDQIIDRIRAQIPAPRIAPFPLVQDRILPVLKPMSFVELFERYPAALRLAWRPLTDDVAVTYAVNARDQRTVVTREMLAAWDQSINAIHTVAVENLRRQTEHVLEEIGARRTRYEHLDGFDATRVLVADLLAPAEIPDPVVAIPEETVLLVAPASDWEALQAEAAGRHAASTRPLTPALFDLAGRPYRGPLAASRMRPVDPETGVPSSADEVVFDERSGKA
jgi:hypothetical protein